MRPPNYDRSPIYTDGNGLGWVGYGIFDEWPSACLWIVNWKPTEKPMRPRVIFEGHDKGNAEFIRATCKSLGTTLPTDWTDEQVIQFFNTVSEDEPRLYTDNEKAELKFAGQ